MLVFVVPRISPLLFVAFPDISVWYDGRRSSNLGFAVVRGSSDLAFAGCRRRSYHIVFTGVRGSSDLAFARCRCSWHIVFAGVRGPSDLAFAVCCVPGYQCVV